MAQTRFSLATDFSGQRGLKKGQRYWSFGQTVTGHFHVTPKDGLYAWIYYNSKAKFRENVEATGRLILTNPGTIPYVNTASINFKHISFGYRRYLTGNFSTEKGLNTYGIAGLGLMIGSIENKHSVAIDTVDYYLPVLSGKSGFKRLTLDLGIGAEVPVGADVFLYADAKTYIPLTWYPSRYFLQSKYAPLTACVNIGFRILFD